jgi:protein-S-isoprenylcysteine O-methyltransferase Ste14
MPQEKLFRLALLVVILLAMTVAAYYRIKAAASGERISHREEGYAFAVVLRLSGLALWVSIFAYLFYPPAVAWAAIPLSAWVRWMGVAACACCSVLMYWTLSSLGKNLTDTVVVRTNASLVTHGPYRWVRHPFYVTVALLIGSVTLVSANSLIGVTGLVVLVLLAVRTPKEEQMLLQRFGQPYRDYMAGTGRFFPRVVRG